MPLPLWRGIQMLSQNNLADPLRNMCYSKKYYQEWGSHLMFFHLFIFFFWLRLILYLVCWSSLLQIQFAFKYLALLQEKWSNDQVHLDPLILKLLGLLFFRQCWVKIFFLGWVSVHIPYFHQLSCRFVVCLSICIFCVSGCMSLNFHQYKKKGKYLTN